MDAVKEIKTLFSRYLNQTVIGENEENVKAQMKERITHLLDFLSERYLDKEGFYFRYRNALSTELENLIQRHERSFGEEAGIKTALRMLDKCFEETTADIVVENENRLTQLKDVYDCLEDISNCEFIRTDDTLYSRIQILKDIISERFTSDEETVSEVNTLSVTFAKNGTLYIAER